ncbi:MAG: PIN domain-containing protein [Egibacteraceae bacterium]
MSGYTLDAGALIALEGRDRRVAARLAEALRRGAGIAVPAGALAQVWRDGRRQVLLARLLADDGVEVVPLDDLAAREAGQLCGVAGTADIVDASVVRCARTRGHVVLTSDPDDLRRLDATLPLRSLA